MNKGEGQENGSLLLVLLIVAALRIIVCLLLALSAAIRAVDVMVMGYYFRFKNCN